MTGILLGTQIGACSIADSLIVFTHDLSSIDRIYKIKAPNSTFNSQMVKLFEGNLGFSFSSKIQSIAVYENESIQKVYWIDGINQPRVINVAIEDSSIYKYVDTSFDFYKDLNFNESVSIDKKYSGGIFKSGVIQYAATYYNTNSSETGIFYMSDLLAISPDGRGGKPDESINNSFELSLSNLDNRFDYIRIYSIVRNSLNTSAEVKIVSDIKIPPTRNIQFIDTGSIGTVVDSDILLYINRDKLIPTCMATKSTTLFFGGLNVTTNPVTPIRISGFNVSNNFSWSRASGLGMPLVKMESSDGDSLYPYSPDSLRGYMDTATSLKAKNIIHFKFGEYYRLGIQGRCSNGAWSSPIYLGTDFLVDKKYGIELADSNKSVYVDPVYGKLILPDDVVTNLKSLYGFKYIRPVIAEAKLSDKVSVAQGVVNNTLGIVSNRWTGIPNSVYSIPDYFFRSGGNLSSDNASFGTYKHGEFISPNDPYVWGSLVSNSYAENAGMSTTSLKSVYLMENNSENAKSNYMFVDKNMVTMWSPDIVNDFDLIKAYSESINVAKLNGFAIRTGSSFNFSLDAGEFTNGSRKTNTGGLIYNYSGDNQEFTNPKSLNCSFLNSNTSNNTKIYIPTWGPSINTTIGPANIDVTFTKYMTSNFIYMGYNSLLKTTKSLEIPINRPSFLNESQIIRTDVNSELASQTDGIALYSKDVDISYTASECKNLYVESEGVPNVVKSTDSGRGFEMKYLSNSHAVFSLGKTSDGYINLVPKLSNNATSDDLYSTKYPWDSFSANYTLRANVLNMSEWLEIVPPIIDLNLHNAVPIFDICKTVDLSTIYGGSTDNALINNNWIIAGDKISTSSYTSIDGGMNLIYSIGDTYINRYDLLRIYPEDINQIPQVSEIISFLCESRVNLDGRSDINRKVTNSSTLRPSTYGLLNNAYSQKDNYFNYSIIDPSRFNVTKFASTVVWSKSKTYGELVDTWSSTNMLSSIDLNGIYGNISSINVYNDDIYVFQPKGIARLLFNERVQQQASDGISIEVLNGYKVPEYRYITNQYGCSNRLSTVTGKGGIYFLDSINNSFNSIGNGLSDISVESGFKSWFNSADIDSLILSYDRINNDVYVHNKNICLNYSELSKTFVSFFDYLVDTNMIEAFGEFVSFNKPPIVVDSTSIWIHGRGDYNSFYGNLSDSHVELVSNADSLAEKIFDTLEYRLNMDSENWNSMSVSNIHQYGEYNKVDYLNKDKFKFNTHRLHLPRNSSDKKRIFGIWSKIKLKYTPESNTNGKLEMFDSSITYTV